MKKTVLVLSCEHASEYIPENIFDKMRSPPAFNTFQTFDPYAKELTKSIANTLKCDYFLGDISRFILDLNKKNAYSFSKWSRQHFSEGDKHDLLEKYYQPYRQKLTQNIEMHIENGCQILHLSVHTFNNESRYLDDNAAIGLLYNPNRHGEKEVARIWNELLIKRTPYRVRLNFPRSGRHNNLTSSLRKDYPESDYLGLEIEANISLLNDPVSYDEFCEALIHSIYTLIEMI